jgi:hypothetical protein
LKIHDVAIERNGHGGGEFRSVPNARDPVDPAVDAKAAAGEKIAFSTRRRLAHGATS